MGWFILYSVFLYSCSDKEKYITLTGQAQGTTFHITYRDSLARDFSGQVDSLFRVIDRSMSLWDSSSLISRFNRNEDIKPDTHFMAVFQKAKEIGETTDGAFDATIGPLVRAWGFTLKNNGPDPDSILVDSLMRFTGYQKVKFLNGAILKEDPRLQLDFNAIAQGYTVDLISSFLRRKDIRHFLVEIGGEVRAQGLNQMDSIWKIGIDKPVENPDKGRPLQTIVSLKDKALATSGSYRKYRMLEGKRLSHVIDPSTGLPVQHGLLSVSVIAEDCMTADAYATAFLVMGMDKALKMAAEKNMEILGIYEDSSGLLQTNATQGFLK